MKIEKAYLFAAALLITITLVGAAQAQKATPKYTNVTSSVSVTDYSSPSTIQGDGQGVYQNGVGSVTSQIQPIGDWELDMLSSTTRFANVNIGPAIESIAGRQAPGPGAYHARFLTQCSNYGATLPAMLVGQPYKCGLIVGFNVGADRYTMRFYTKNAPAVGSEDVAVSCNGAAGGKCNSWSISSTGGVDAGKLRARLFKVLTSRNSTTYVDYGLYAFSFDASFTNP